MKTFKEGKKYFGRSICDTDCIIRIQIVKRTNSFVTVKFYDKNHDWPTKQTRFKVQTSRDIEYIQLGQYSMAPIISADRLAK